MNDFNMNYPLRYCVNCGRIVAVISTSTGEFHTSVSVWDDEMEASVGTCNGPFTVSTPPENFSDDWDLELVEPDGDELFIINRNADSLLADVLGE